MKSHLIAAIIATENRTNLLKKRAVKSVINQSTPPDYLIIVDNSTAAYKDFDKEFLNALTMPSCEIFHIQNKRTQGAGGAWNTGIDFMLDLGLTLENVFVAFLDDDDKWDPSYINSCRRSALDHDADFISTSFYRIENTPKWQKLIVNAPNHIDPDMFLKGNQGIRGSNIFIRLNVILMAGCFDEALQSSTNSDLFIRVCDLGFVKYKNIKQPLITHYAGNNQHRLSNPKSNGLNTFWKKYKGRMDEEQKLSFCERSELKGHNNFRRKLIGFDRNMSKEYFKLKNIVPECTNKTPFNLYIGVITNDSNSLGALLESISIVEDSSQIEKISVIILCNGIAQNKVQESCIKFQTKKLTLNIIGESQQQKDAREGVFGERLSHRTLGQLGIAHARSMIQKYIGKAAQKDDSSIAWILDDDMTLDTRAVNYLTWLPTFKKNGIDVLIGSYENSSPNPPINGIRVQLVDLFHNLIWLQNLPLHSILPNRAKENKAFREKYPDYYYDLSRKHSAHLEFPCWIEPKYKGEIVDEAYKRLIHFAPFIISGHPLTRPIVSTPYIDNPIAYSKDSVNRGGNTFILNMKTILETPNITTSINGQEARRSDMIWAVINKYKKNRIIQAVPFPVIHASKVNEELSLNTDKVVAEINGSAFYGSINEFLAFNSTHTFNFSKNEALAIWQLFIKHRKNRLHKLKQSFIRITGLAKAISNISKNNDLDNFLYFLSVSFTLENFKNIEIQVQLLKQDNIVDFILNLNKNIRDFGN